MNLYYKNISADGKLGEYAPYDKEPTQESHPNFEWTGFVAETNTEKSWNGLTYVKAGVKIEGFDHSKFLGAPAKPQSEINKEQIAEYKAYLVSTDWVVSKCYEVPEEKDKYADVFEARALARYEINKLGG